MVEKEIILPPKSSDGKNGEHLALENGFELQPYRNTKDHYEGKAWYRNIPRRVFEKYGNISNIMLKIELSYFIIQFYSFVLFQKKGIIMTGLPRGYALAGKADYTGRVNRHIFGKQYFKLQFRVIFILIKITTTDIKYYFLGHPTKKTYRSSSKPFFF